MRTREGTLAMRTIWYIAKKDLLQTIKDRNSLFFMLAVPLILIAVIGLAFGNLFGGASSQITINVAVSNQDTGYVGTSIVNALQINTDQLKITVHQHQDAQQVTDQVANASDVNAVFFALFGINAAAATILEEKEEGTFRRLLIAPIHKYALLGGKLLAQFILTLVQLSVLFAVGYFAFHLDVGSWPALIALLVATSFAATGLGILLVSIVKTRRQLNPIVTLVVLISSAIVGAWWPLFLEPQWMQSLAKLGLTAWAMEGLNGIMILGKDFTQVMPDLLGLLAY